MSFLRRYPGHTSMFGSRTCVRRRSNSDPSSLRKRDESVLQDVAHSCSCMSESESIKKFVDWHATGQLLELYRRGLIARAKWACEEWLGARESVSDLVQNTLIVAHADFAAFRGNSPGELGAWLRRILDRRVQNTRRHHKARKRDAFRVIALTVSAALPGAGTSPSGAAIRCERKLALLNQFAQLDDEQRQLVLWRHCDNLSWAEISERMGCSPDAAKQRCARILAGLKRALGPDHDPGG